MSAKSMDVFEENERKATDVPFLIVKGVFMLILVCFLGYCYAYSDLDRLEIGYDDCGNVCGFANKPDDKLACKGGDKTNEKYLFEDEYQKKCVAKCETLNQVTPKAGFKCLTVNEKKEITIGDAAEVTRGFIADLKACSFLILLTLAVSFCLSAIVLGLFRYFIKYIVWLILVVVCIAFVAITVISWKHYLDQGSQSHHESGHHREESIVGPIFITILAIASPILIYVFRKEIKLTIQLLREASKAIADMILLMFLPCVTTILLVTVVYLWIQFVVMIESAAVFTVVGGKARYEHTSAMVFAQFLNCFGFFWFTQFLLGCQHLIVGGAVGKWFFTRQKANANNFVMMSTDNLMRFHMGTAALGSLVGMLIKVIRSIVKGIKGSLENRLGCASFLWSMCDGALQFLEYLSKTAYIVTGMFGYSFYQAGKKAFNVLLKNAKDIIIVKTVGNMVMATGKIFIVVGSVIIGISLLSGTVTEDNALSIYILVGLLTYLLAHCFISIYEMAFDTVFISFCEDCERNDGRNYPYFMSVKLVKFLEDANVLKKDGLNESV